MLFKAKIKDIPVGAKKKLKGSNSYELSFSAQMAEFSGREYQFESLFDFFGDEESADWFRSPDKSIQFYYFHESWIDKSKQRS